MKKLLNTIFINQQNAYLHKERETIIVKVGDEKIGQFPALVIHSIFCFGQVTVSPPLLAYCIEQSIEVAYFTEFGRFLCRILGTPKGNVILRRTQFRWADDNARSTSIARNMIAGKIANSRAVLQRELRNAGPNVDVSHAILSLQRSLNNLKYVDNVPSVMGLEGEAASIYFGVFNNLIKNNQFNFEGRFKRPPTDNVNALLSFLYTLLASECTAALSAVGLDPYVGYLHQDRPGRKSLALDLMEEFRAPIADRFVLTMINRGQIKNRDFIKDSSGAVSLKVEARKEILKAYQERKQELVLHPYLNEKIAIGLLPHAQALLLARHLRGDIELYPPYLIK